MKRITKRIKTAVSSRSLKKIILEFAERCDLLYFGYVSQLSDEHRLVRGLTVSTRHRDHHYCIGTYKDYNVVFVERTDTILTNHTHTWHILEFDLKSKADIPHMFIGSERHGLGFHALLKAKFPKMAPLSLGTTAKYPSEFTDYFHIYTRAVNAVEAEQLITPEPAKLIGEHFKGLAVEITKDALFIYSEKTQLSGRLLDVMMANGIWLAQVIDKKYQA